MTTLEPNELESLTPKDLYNKLLEDIAVHGQATETFINNFQYHGKSLRQHSDDLWIEIPEKVTPELFREIFVKLARNIQIASHYYSVASSISNALLGSSRTRKSDLMRAIAESYERQNRRRPGQDLIEKMAESYMNGTSNVTVASKIVKDYWKQKVDSLIEVRKCMEQIGISMTVEMKYMEHSI